MRPTNAKFFAKNNANQTYTGPVAEIISSSATSSTVEIRYRN